MGLIIKLKNIYSVNDFKLFFDVGRTPGSVSQQKDITWGTQYYGGDSIGGVFSGGTTTITIDLMDEDIDNNPYGKQFWFKILDIINGNYIIENIFIHDFEFYESCIPDCVLEGNVEILVTPTPTPTPDCVLSGNAEFYVTP